MTEEPTWHPVRVLVWLRGRAHPMDFTLRWPTSAPLPATPHAWAAVLADGVRKPDGSTDALVDEGGAAVWWDTWCTEAMTVCQLDAPKGAHHKLINATVRCAACGAVEQRAEFTVGGDCPTCQDEPGRVRVEKDAGPPWCDVCNAWHPPGECPRG